MLLRWGGSTRHALLPLRRSVASAASATSATTTTEAGLQCYSERRLLRFPPAAVYTVVADVSRYHEFVPWCVASRVVAQRPGYLEAELAVGFRAFSERYTSRVTLEPSSRIVAVASDTRLFHALTNEWRVAPGPSPHTSWLDVAVAFRFRSGLYARASALFLDEVVQRTAAAFERRCEALAAAEGLREAEGVQQVLSAAGGAPGQGGGGRRGGGGGSSARGGGGAWETPSARGG